MTVKDYTDKLPGYDIIIIFTLLFCKKGWLIFYIKGIFKKGIDGVFYNYLFCRWNPDDAEDDSYRRVNPNLPPKNLACIHQQESGLWKCLEACPNEAKPAGWNIPVIIHLD